MVCGLLNKFKACVSDCWCAGSGCLSLSGSAVPHYVGITMEVEYYLYLYCNVFMCKKKSFKGAICNPSCAYILYVCMYLRQPADFQPEHQNEDERLFK